MWSVQVRPLGTPQRGPQKPESLIPFGLSCAAPLKAGVSTFGHPTLRRLFLGPALCLSGTHHDPALVSPLIGQRVADSRDDSTSPLDGELWPVMSAELSPASEEPPITHGEPQGQGCTPAHQSHQERQHVLTSQQQIVTFIQLLADRQGARLGS